MITLATATNQTAKAPAALKPVWHWAIRSDRGYLARVCGQKEQGPMPEVPLRRRDLCPACAAIAETSALHRPVTVI